MDNISINGGSSAQYDHDTSSIEVDHQFPLAAVGTITNGMSMYSQLPQYLCDWYGCIGNIETASEVCSDYFLREYAVKCGYQLTEAFLSIMNKYKINFMDKVDSILTNLYSSFNFLKESEHNLINISNLINEVSLSFSKKVYELKLECVDVLRYDIIPIVIRIIFNSKVIDGIYERDMTYSEMEQLFLHFVATLEKLIVVRAMKYWHCFCSLNKGLLSLISDVDYSNPFVCTYNFYGIDALNVTCPAAFTNKFDKYISFMAIAKIDEMVGDFISSCNDSLKIVISSKCSRVCYNSDKAYDYIKEVRDKFMDLVKEEFDKKIIEEVIKDRFTNFLDNIVIWNSNDGAVTNRLSVFDNIIEYMRNLFLVNTVTSDAFKILNSFQVKLSLYQRLLMFGKDFSEIEKNSISNFEDTSECHYQETKESLFYTEFEEVSRQSGELPVIIYFFPMGLLGKSKKITDMWGLNLHPADDELIFFIRKKFSIKIKNHLTKLFSGMLKSRVMLPSGMVLRASSWDIISSELCEIAIKSVESITKMQLEELDKALSKSRVIEISESNGHFLVIRKITDDEKKNLMSYINKIAVKRLKSSIRLTWLNVINKSSTYVGSGHKEDYNHISVKCRGGSWGFRLRYVDSISILRTRKKFSSKIKDFVHDKFIRMLKNKHRFNDGTFIGAFAWFRVSEKLTPIAKKEVKPILKDQLEELEKIISKAYVVVDSGVDRVLTKEEKHIVLENNVKISHNALRFLFKRAWSDVILSVRTNNVEDTIEVDSSDNLKVNLCHEDDYAILDVRRKFSFEICRFIRKKYIEIIKENHKVDDGTVLGKCAWRKASKKIFPIIKKEIDAIIDKEREEIGNILLKSHIDISSPNSSSSIGRMVREITCDERLAILENIMESINRQAVRKFGQIWNRIIKLVSASFDDLVDEYKLELDNIRLEFIGNLGLIVKEVVDSLSTRDHNDISSDVYSIVSERGYALFNEGGFLDRVESLLSCAKVIDISGNYRFITDEEKKFVLKEFIDMIYTDRDCLIKKRVIY